MDHWAEVSGEKGVLGEWWGEVEGCLGEILDDDCEESAAVPVGSQ